MNSSKVTTQQTRAVIICLAECIVSPFLVLIKSGCLQGRQVLARLPNFPFVPPAWLLETLESHLQANAWFRGKGEHFEVREHREILRPIWEMWA